MYCTPSNLYFSHATNLFFRSMEDKKFLVDSCSLASVSKVEGVGHWVDVLDLYQRAKLIFTLTRCHNHLKRRQKSSSIFFNVLED